MQETILFTVDRDDYTVRAGLPPHDPRDNFAARAAVLGKLEYIRKIAFSPKGQLYVIRDGDLYVGPLPSPKHDDWFSVAKRVGRGDWDTLKFFLFHPEGELYAATYEGKLYKGPAPDNEYVPWLYAKATEIGGAGWDTLDALFFDSKGMLHAVTLEDKLVKRSPPTSLSESWLDSSVTIGNQQWVSRTHFISFAPDGKLWCIEYGEGDIYSGDPPVAGDGKYEAKNLGKGYSQYGFVAFTTDKIIQQIVSFEFLPDLGQTISETLEVVNDEIYYNKKSTVTLHHTFSFEKTLTQSSEFTHEHGFMCEVGVEITFNGGVPLVAEQGVTLSVNTSTSHNWNFTKANETSVTFSTSSEVEIPAGKAIRMIASVKKAEMEMPYRAHIRTMFGYETTIEGKWKGLTHYNLRVDQEDIK
ncbi:tachylectin-2-like [Spea bombifrons]|uniref:tachylectin-2-like n=1 Tax=Spea bombifrons TaxID=233779 RepID=UPI00234BAC81|nr:tachylectin-2-like [Spea bombifrons]